MKEVAYWTPEKFNVRRKNRNFAPSGGHHDDPLGLSVERSDSKISDAELRELFGDEKNSEIGSDNFDPGKKGLGPNAETRVPKRDRRKCRNESAEIFPPSQRAKNPAKNMKVPKR